MRSHARLRGFTLIELLVGLAVSSVVLLAISFTFISQARQYQAHVSRRAIQASSRQAMGFLERTILRSGYGVDPARAIIPYDSFDAANNVQAAGFPDAIALHTRDPLFVRRASAVRAADITLDTPLTEPMSRGQILLVLCPGARTYTYVTVGVRANAGDTRVALDASIPPIDSPIGPPHLLFRDEERLDTTQPANQCFAGVGTQRATVVKVDRYAFYVASYDDDGNPATPGARPYLMLHRGLDISGATGAPDGQINELDAVPVAEGIEQMQLAYLLNTIHSAQGSTERVPPRIIGMDNTNIPTVNGAIPLPFGERWARTADDRDTPKYEDAYDHARRMTAHPANIRQVRVTLVTRSNVPEQAYAGDDALAPGQPWTQGTFGGTTVWTQMENLGNTPNVKFDPRGKGYYRIVSRQALTPKNMLSRSQFIPTTPRGG